MHRMQRHCLGMAAAIAGLASAGTARAEPHLFHAESFVDFLTPFEASNPGRIANVFGSAPASFEVPANVLAATLSQVFTGSTATRLFSVDNEAGSFRAGAGQGTAGFTPLPSHPGFRVSLSAGPNHFGGTMRLLAQWRWKGSPADPFPYVPIPIGGPFGEAVATMHGGTVGFTTTTLWVLPWTTGAVSAMGTTHMGATIVKTAEGSDLRTPGGMGTIQLVAPFLVRVDPWFLGEQRFVGIGKLTLHFVPEPAAVLLLVSGLAGLALLYRLAHRG